MSIFSKIIKGIESFASKFEKEFQKLLGEAPSWITIVQGVITYAGPLVTTIATLAAGAPAGSAVASILATIKNDLVVASTAAQAGASATSIQTLLASLQTNLPALLAAAKVENLQTVAEIEKIVNLLIPEIDALLEAVPAEATAAA